MKLTRFLLLKKVKGIPVTRVGLFGFFAVAIFAAALFLIETKDAPKPIPYGHGMMDSVLFAYAYGAMDCDVIEPSYGESFNAGEYIYFSASTTEGTYPLDYDTATWISDQDGTLLNDTSGYGSLSTPGWHDITFEIFDSMGYFCSYTTSIEIIEESEGPLEEPWCSISSPDTDSSYAAGESFILSGSWSQGTYEVTDYWFESNLDGTMVDNENAWDYVSLSTNGTHAITFYVVDSYGATCSDTVYVTISGGSDGSEDDYCAENCPNYWLEDGVCDSACDNETCEWDGGDCAVDNDYNPYYDYNCYNDDVWWEDTDRNQTEVKEYCDYGCTNWACNAPPDNDTDIEECSAGCPSTWPGDGVCDSACDNETCEWDGGDCVADNDTDDVNPYDLYSDSMCDISSGNIYWVDSDGYYNEVKEVCEYSCSDETNDCLSPTYEIQAIYPEGGEASEVMENATFHRYYLVTLNDEPAVGVSVIVKDPEENTKTFYSDNDGVLDITFDVDDLGLNTYYTYTVIKVADSEDAIEPIEFEVYISNSNYYKSFTGTFEKNLKASIEVQAEGVEETKRTVTYTPKNDQTRIDLNTKYKGGVGISCGESGIQVEAGSARGFIGYECNISGGLFTDEILGYEIDYTDYADYYDYSTGEKERAFQFFNLLTLGYAHQISPLFSELLKQSAEAISGSLDDYIYKQGLAIGGYGIAEIEAGIGVVVGSGDMTNAAAWAGAGLNGEMAIGANEYPQENVESFVLRGTLNSKGIANIGASLSEDVKLGIATEVWDITGEGTLERFYDTNGTAIETIMTIAGNDAIYEYKFNGTIALNNLWEELEEQGGLSFHGILYYFLTYAVDYENAVVVYTKYANVDQDHENFNLATSAKLLGIGGELGIKLNEDTKTTYVQERWILIGGQEYLLEEYDRPPEVEMSMEDLVLNSFSMANPEFMEALEETGKVIDAANEVLDQGIQTVQNGIMQLSNSALHFLIGE